MSTATYLCTWFDPLFQIVYLIPHCLLRFVCLLDCQSIVLELKSPLGRSVALRRPCSFRTEYDCRSTAVVRRRTQCHLSSVRYLDRSLCRNVEPDAIACIRKLADHHRRETFLNNYSVSWIADHVQCSPDFLQSSCGCVDDVCPSGRFSTYVKEKREKQTY